MVIAHVRIGYWASTVLLSTLAWAGCSGHEQGEPGPHGADDTKALPENGRAPGTTAGATGGAGAIASDPEGIVADTPNATFENLSQADLQLRLTSSHLSEGDAVRGTSYREWLAEIVNDGPSPACFLHGSLTILDASGQEIAKLGGYVEAPPYETGMGTDASWGCLGAGEHGVVWANQIGSVRLDLGAVRTLRWALEGLVVETAVPHPAAPTFTSPKLGVDASQGFPVVGGALVAVKDIYGIGVSTFAYGANGLLQARASSGNRDTVFAGERWPYGGSFPSAKERVVGVVQFTSFLVGMRPPTFPANGAPEPTEEDPAITAARDAIARAQANEAHRRASAW